MPEQATDFFKKNWQGIISMIIIPLVMWTVNHFKELGRMEAELKYKTEQNEILDKYLDVSDDLNECLNGTDQR